MISSIISRLVILILGTLYPAYASYKAVRTKNLKEYVKWMMYWIVFALFTCTETITDVFFSWFPFYYEVKIVLVLWLLSPATKGSSILYRKFVHPALCSREQEIDEYLAKAKEQGYHTVLNLGTKGVNYATTVIMQTAIKGGGGLVQQLRKSYSLSDLTECEPREERGSDEADDVLTEPRMLRRGPKTGYRRSASESNSRSPMYFPEVDVDVRPRPNRSDEPDFSHIKSSEDISSGYSSADNSASLSRAASLGAGAGARAKGRSSRATVTPVKRAPPAEENEVIIEELHDDDIYEYANMPPLVQAPSPIYLSHTDPPFLYQYVGEKVKIIQVLGNYPLSSNLNCNPNNSSNHWDQKESTSKEATLNVNNLTKLLHDNNPRIDDNNYQNSDNRKLSDVPTMENNKQIINMLKIENINETGSLLSDSITESPTRTIKSNTPSEGFDSAESDDEASFGTPDNTPKGKRKSPKGKYGKSKAPPPPKADNNNVPNVDDSKSSEESIRVQENLIDIVSKPNITTETELTQGLQVNDVIAETKRREKSKSPNRAPIASSSGIAKLLQLPNKFAFWHRNDEKTKSDESISSGEHSRRSSTVIDDFQSCNDLSLTGSNVIDISEIPYIKVTEDLTAGKASANNDATQEIIDKSDALRKVIEEKLESHPEYKFISLHEETTSSKSTDV